MQVIIRLVIFALTALIIGLGSAWYAVDRGTALTTAQFGPWTLWRSAGKTQADPYSRAHVARSGRLPITASSAVYLVATTDGHDALTSECEYHVDIPDVPALWWSLTLYDRDGRPIANPAERHSFTNRNVSPLMDGRTTITINSTARPGYWLPSGEDQDLMLIFRILRPREDPDTGVLPADMRPQINKVACR